MALLRCDEVAAVLVPDVLTVRCRLLLLAGLERRGVSRARDFAGLRPREHRENPQGYFARGPGATGDRLSIAALAGDPLDTVFGVVARGWRHGVQLASAGPRGSYFAGVFDHVVGSRLAVDLAPRHSPGWRVRAIADQMSASVCPRAAEGWETYIYRRAWNQGGERGITPSVEPWPFVTGVAFARVADLEGSLLLTNARNYCRTSAESHQCGGPLRCSLGITNDDSPMEAGS